MKTENDISQVSAELLLNYLYPEMQQEWIADNKGSFYRNYNEDILAVYPDEHRVELSRDGFLKLLPQGIIASEDDLRKTKDILAKSKEQERHLHRLNEAFLPLDALHFRRSLKMERQVSELLSTHLEFLLKEYFGFDLNAEQNPYVKALAVLLPFAKSYRGDFTALKHVLEALFGCQVVMTTGRYSESDSTLGWMPLVRYELLIADLDAEAYRTLNSELQPFADFIKEWFIPAETICQIKIKEHGAEQRMNGRLTLEYNTELKIEN